MIYKYKDYSIRTIEESDLELLLKWRNSDRIRNVMLTSHIIEWEEHYAWFNRIKDREVATNFVFCYKSKPLGYIGYSDIDEIEKSCSYGVYIGDVDFNVPSEAPFILYFFAIEYAFMILKIKTIYAIVLEKNKKALAFNMFLGYRVQKHKKYCNLGSYSENIIELYLDESTWYKNNRDFKIEF